MIKKMFGILGLVAMLAVGVKAQDSITNSDGTVITRPTSITQTLADLLSSTNGLLNAQEVDLTVFGSYSRLKSFGGGGRVSYWLASQGGTEVSYINYGDGSSEFDAAACGRTTFSQLETRISLGVSQSTDDEAGLVKLYTEVSFLYRIPVEKVDIRPFVGVKFNLNERPQINFGFTFPFSK